MGEKRSWVLWASAGLAALLWLATGAVGATVRWNDLLGSTIDGVLPATVPLSVWAQPQPWPFVAVLVGAIAVFGAHRTITFWTLASSSRSSASSSDGDGDGHSLRIVFVVVWFAAVAAGGLVGLAHDVAVVIGAQPVPRFRMLLDGIGVDASSGVFWGVLQGWIPALLVVLVGMRAGRRAATIPASPAFPAPRSTGRRATGVVTAVATLAVIAVTPVGVAGARAAVVAAAHAEAIDEGFDEEAGALPDPFVGSTPVPTVAPSSVVPASDWCTPDQAMLLMGDQDAATGHRSLSIRLLNFSDAMCVVDGYPDIAFADQNDNVLPVTLTNGSSFMATDPGEQRVEIPAGGEAIVFLGWTANATQGALVASTISAAPFAGETRGSWSVRTDITEGSSVSVTAWALLPPASDTTP